MDSNGKHAYLIIAHKDDFTFHTLLTMLDDERNDIFIHMDCKAKSYCAEKTEELLHRSNVYHTVRTNVVWGAYSQVNAELVLIETATERGHYQFYHLLSGEDIPIKTQDYIHDFFERNNEKEFIGYDSQQERWGNRASYYYFLHEYIGRKRTLLKKSGKSKYNTSKSAGSS